MTEAFRKLWLTENAVFAGIEPNPAFVLATLFSKAKVLP